MNNRSVPFFVLAVLFLLSLPVPVCCAEATGILIEDIAFDQESDRETVTFRLNAVYIPKMFAHRGNTPKVVFDFYNTGHSAAIKNVIKCEGNIILAIRTGMHHEPKMKTRVVLDLAVADDYDFEIDFKKDQKILTVSIFHTKQKEEAQPQAQTDEEGG